MATDRNDEILPVLSTLELGVEGETRRFAVVRDAVLDGNRYEALVTMEQISVLASVIENAETDHPVLPQIDLIWVLRSGKEIRLVESPDILAGLDRIAAESVFGRYPERL